MREERAAEEEDVGMVESVLVLSWMGLGVSLVQKTGAVETERADEIDDRRFNAAASAAPKRDGEDVISSTS